MCVNVGFVYCLSQYPVIGRIRQMEQEAAIVVSWQCATLGMRAGTVPQRQCGRGGDDARSLTCALLSRLTNGGVCVEVDSCLLLKI